MCSQKIEAELYRVEITDAHSHKQLENIVLMKDEVHEVLVAIGSVLYKREKGKIINAVQ